MSASSVCSSSAVNPQGNGSGGEVGDGGRPPLYLKDVSAYGSGTAGVRSDGRVLSWGSGRSGRLGHGDDGSCVLEPKLIEGIGGQRISMVHLAEEEILAFAPTTLVKIEPVAGPMQGNSRFVISGSGLWASDKIVVRFEPMPNGALEKMYPKAEFEPFPRARSTIGKFHCDPLTGVQSISCRTPNMADTQKSLKKLMAAFGTKDSDDTARPLAGNKTGTKGTGVALSGGGGDQVRVDEPPHPQPMTISVSMNGVDFVVVGEKPTHGGGGGR